MGATTFSNFGKGTDAKEVFRELTERARWAHGHGGYTGTIAEKRSFTVITDKPEAVLARLSAQEHSHARRVLADAIAGGSKANIARALADALLDLGDTRVDDKWGPAGALQVDAEGWLFFGWAAE
jgi:hypothetical protein